LVRLAHPVCNNLDQARALPTGRGRRQLPFSDVGQAGPHIIPSSSRVSAQSSQDLGSKVAFLLRCFRYFVAQVTSVIAILGLLAAVPARADDFTLSGLWTDTAAYFTSPLHWDTHGWELFGGTVATIIVAHQVDGTVRDHFAGKDPVLSGREKNSTTEALPAAALVAGTWVAAWASDSDAGRSEAYRMLEAAALGGVTTEALKFAAARQRPNETLQVDAWRKGGSSFPSLHATAAFAIGTVFAESGTDDYRWLRRIIGYGVAGGTAYARLHDNAHWLSDLVAGTAVGVYAGSFTMNRSNYHRDLALSIVLGEYGGVALHLTYTPH
jgi:membrane-associated phospholipid phosphatase